MEKEKKQNIITVVIVVIALLLAGVVVLVQTGVLDKNEPTTTTEEETVIESRIVVESTVNENGETEYYTMVEHYVRPKVTSNHRYPTTTTKPTESEESTTETTIEYTEISKVVAVTNAEGQVEYEDNGEIKTEVVKYTEVVTTEPTTEPTETTETETTTEYVPITEYQTVTDKVFKTPVYKNGKVVTETVVLNPTTTTTEPTTTDRWSENTQSDTTTTKKKITTNYSADSNLEKAILDELNEERGYDNLAPLTSDKDLKTAARTNCIAMFEPSINKETRYPKIYTFISGYGGKELYNVVFTSGAGTTALSADVTKVGIGVYKSGDKYYTTIIFE